MSILVNSIDSEDNVRTTAQQTRGEKDLVAYVMGYVDEWKDYRDNNFEADWGLYYRMWRGIWKQEDKQRNSERSKLISPALQQAIELQVSEMEEATFNKDKWFDLSDNIADEDKSEMEPLRDQLIEDCARAGVPQAIAEAYLNGAMYGTGIAKVVVDELVDNKLTAQGIVEETRIQISVVPIHPEEFVIDPVAKGINDALGCAHDTIKPRHDIEAKKASGLYMDKDLGTWNDDIDVTGKGEVKEVKQGDKTRITEWHGLVPKNLIDRATIDLEEDEELVSLFDDYDTEKVYEDNLVECVVTVANGSILLRAVENPFLMKDRSIVAYQHDKVPNRFWGRGVAEKGINAQRALDAELRGRIDAMALAIHPMMAVDGTRLPRGVRPSVSPGKTIITNGPPADVIREFKFTPPGQLSFMQGGELERMITTATGSMDTAAGVGSQPRNNTASGMSMMQSSAIKRTKRTMQNVERDFLGPMVRKIAWRYMQFDNERYPMDDYDFIPRSSMGMMAREFEQQQMTNLLQMMPPGSPAMGLILSQIIDNSNGDNKDMLKQSIEQMFNPQPDPQQQQMEQMVQELAMKKAQMEIEELQSKIQLNQAQAGNYIGSVKVSQMQAAMKQVEIEGKIQDEELDRELERDKLIADIKMAEAKEETARFIAVQNAEAAFKQREEAESKGKESSEPKAPVVQPLVVNITEGNKPTKKKITLSEDGTSGEIEEI